MRAASAMRATSTAAHGLHLLRDPLGQLIECACYKFEPPVGATHADVLREGASAARGAATTTSPTSTWPMRSGCSSSQPTVAVG